MDEQQRQEILRRYNEGMCAMSDAQMMERAAAQEGGMRQRGPMTDAEQQGLRNFYGGTADEHNNFIPTPPPTLWQRFQAWRERTGFFMDGRDGGM
jgi:hypothetical protein